jgi:hypothetical protein
MKAKSKLENYLYLAASFLFLFLGAFLLTPNMTGFAITENFAQYKLNFIGVISFVFAMCFLLVFLKKEEKKKVK